MLDVSYAMFVDGLEYLSSVTMWCEGWGDKLQRYRALWEDCEPWCQESGQLDSYYVTQGSKEERLHLLATNSECHGSYYRGDERWLSITCYAGTRLAVMHKYRVKKAQGRKGNSYLGVSKRIDNTSEFVVSDFTKQDSRWRFTVSLFLSFICRIIEFVI